MWEWISPGIALLLTELAINFIGDGLSGRAEPGRRAPDDSGSQGG